MNSTAIRNSLILLLLPGLIISLFLWNKERHAAAALELQKNWFRARLCEKQAGESSNPALQQRLALEALALPLPADKIPVAALSRLVTPAGRAPVPQALWRSPVAGKRIYYGLDFQPGGNLLASGASDPLVRLWNSTTGFETGVLSGHDNVVLAVRFRPDGKLLASGSHDGSIRLWNLPDGSAEAQLTGHARGVLCLDFSSDGMLLASGSQDHTVRIWDLKTRRTIQQLAGHSGMVLDIAFSDNGRYLLSAGQDNSVRVWDVARGTPQEHMTRHTAAVQSIAVAPDGKTIASGDAGGTLIIWQRGHSGDGRSVATGSAIADLLFEENGRYLLVAGAAGQIQRRDLATLEISTEWLAHPGGINALARHPSGLLASSGLDKTLRLWDAGGSALARLTGHHRDVLSLAVSSDGSSIASGSLDCEIRIWDTQSGLETGLLQGHSAEILAMEFSPDSKLLLSASADHSIRLWQLPEGKTLYIDQSHNGAVHCLDWHSDSGLLASGSADRSVKVWRIQDRSLSEQLTITGYGGEVVSVAISSDGKHLYSASRDGRLKMHDAINGKLLREWPAVAVDYWHSRFQDNGRAFVSAANDSTIALYSLNGTEPAKRFAYQAKSIRSIALDNRQQLLAAADSDGRISCFDTRSAKLLFSWKPHHRDIWQLLFEKRDNTLLSAGRDNQLARWSLPPTGASEQFSHRRVSHSFFTDTLDAPLLVASARDSLLLLDGLSGRNIRAILAPDLAVGTSFRASPVRLICYTKAGKLVSLELPDLRRRDLLAPSDWISFSLSADGSTIAGCSRDGELTVLDAQSGKNLFTRYLPAFARSLAFQPDGRRLAADCASDELLLFNSADGSIVYRSTQRGTTLLSAGNRMAVLLSNGEIVLQKLPGGETTGRLSSRLAKIDRMAFTADGRLLALAGGGNALQIEIWDAERLLLLAAVDLPASAGSSTALRDLLFAGDGQSLFYLPARQLVQRLDIVILNAYLNAGPASGLLAEQRQTLDARYGFVRSEEGISEPGPAQYLIPLTPSALTAGKALRDLQRPAAR